MDRDYLIIYCTPKQGISHSFMETEKELIERINTCNDFGWEIIFAAKIAIVKEFVG